MEENQTLRNLLRNLSAFIGDGAGGFLPKMGWTLNDFNNFINKSETDTAWESYQRRKKNSTNPASPSTSLNQSQKRPAEDDNVNSSLTKKSRGPGEQDDEVDGGHDRFNLLVPMNSSAPHLSMYPPSARPPHDGNMFTDLLKGSGSPIFARTPPATNSPAQYSGTSSSNVATYQTPYMTPININVDPSLPALPFSSSNTHNSRQQRLTQINQQDSTEDDDDNSNKTEAYKLIGCVLYPRQLSVVLNQVGAFLQLPP